MKKFVSGIIVGALLFAGVSAAADGVGIIGKKVTGVYTIEKNGKQIAEAAIINGSAYAPVRAVAEASGAGLTVEGKRIIMSEGAAVSTSNDIAINVPTSAENRELLETAIKQKEFNIADLEKSIGIYESMAKELANNGDLGKRAQSSADEYKKLVEQRKAELVELKQQLVNLGE